MALRIKQQPKTHSIFLFLMDMKLFTSNKLETVHTLTCVEIITYTTHLIPLRGTDTVSCIKALEIF